MTLTKLFQAQTEWERLAIVSAILKQHNISIPELFASELGISICKESNPELLARNLAREIAARNQGNVPECFKPYHTPLAKQDPQALQSTLEKLDKLTGLKSVKADFEQTILATEAMLSRRAAGHPVEMPSYHSVFTGNPGTGKTTVARLMGQAYQSLGILSRGHVVEVTRTDLVGEYVGATAPKTRKKLVEALDGILFIDEAYALIPSTGQKDYGSEAINEILQFMENYRDRIIVIAAGYAAPMTTFVNSNPGLQSRFTKFLNFDDFNPIELATIFDTFCVKSGFRLSPEFRIRLLIACHEMYDKRDEKFGNARDVRTLFEGCQSRYLARNSRTANWNSPLIAEDLNVQRRDIIEDILQGRPAFAILCPHCNSEIAWTPDQPQLVKCPKCHQALVNVWGLMKSSCYYKSLSERDDSINSLDQLFAELEEMIGLASVKTCIRQVMDSVKVQQLKRRRGLPTGGQISLHMVFMGSPGTGKTTVARLVGKILRGIGVLTKGHCVEVDRSKLLGGYVGQTEQITSQKLDEAMDGVLFIDEAYSLASQSGGNDFGPRAVEIILKRMEDARDRIVVIAAGYQDDIKHFLDANAGLASRFANHILFEDYTPDELLFITDSMANAAGLVIDQLLRQKIYEFFIARYADRNKNFSNARLARNLFERICMVQNSRIGSVGESLSNEELQTLNIEDWPSEHVLARIV